MTKILLNIKNIYFRFAMMKLIEDLIVEHENITYDFNYNIKNISTADIIFTEMVVGEFSLCHDTLNNRSDAARIFIIHSQKGPVIKNPLPNCIKGSVFIYEKDLPGNIKKTMARALDISSIKTTNESASCSLRRCLDCQCNSVTAIQLKILYATSIGLNTSDIAKKLSMNYKTVFSHKRNVMTKFNLANKQELQKFANLFGQKKK
ncbi:TPA: helix-turn-helix transcriptional regulator [Raoultella ornithinolytica]|nr:helix-turn-helix transcriptional regulator [Raoultella ornithinolytica]HAT1614152.1 helix-turn-helix transcriptional regulator [Raoultella ornithinolytica]